MTFFKINKNANTRWSLLPLWIKFFTWMFLIFGLVVIVGAFLNLFFGIPFSLSILGLKANNIFSVAGIILVLILLFKFIVAIFLYSGKKEAFKLAFIDGVLSSIISLTSIVSFYTPVFLLEPNRLDLSFIITIPYTIFVFRHIKKWEELEGENILERVKSDKYIFIFLFLILVAGSFYLYKTSNEIIKVINLSNRIQKDLNSGDYKDIYNISYHKLKGVSFDEWQKITALDDKYPEEIRLSNFKIISWDNAIYKSKTEKPKTIIIKGVFIDYFGNKKKGSYTYFLINNKLYYGGVYFGNMQVRKDHMHFLKEISEYNKKIEKKYHLSK